MSTPRFVTSAVRQISTKGSRRQLRKKDDKLRRAVELYHLSPAFFPIPKKAAPTAAISATPKDTDWEQNLDKTIYSAILDTDAVTRRISNLAPRGLQEFARDESSRAASVPNLASSSAQERAARRAKIAHSFASDITSSDLLAQKEHQKAPRAATPAAAAGGSPSGNSSSSSSTGLHQFTDRDFAMYERRHEQSNSSDLMKDFSLVSHRLSGAERRSNLDRVTPGGNEWYGSQNLDARSARIRDAIFGTVSGELPGLEIVRERFAQMQAGLSQEQQQQQQPTSSADQTQQDR